MPELDQRTSHDSNGNEGQRLVEGWLVDEWALEYLSELNQWEFKTEIFASQMYWKEYVECPEVFMYLLSRVGAALEEARVDVNGKGFTYSVSALLKAAFMGGMLVGVRQVRKGRPKVPADIELRYARTSEWVKNELDQQRGGEHADRYLQGIREEEQLLGYTRGTLADREWERDTRLAAVLDFAGSSLEMGWPHSDPERLVRVAVEVFKLGLAAGARAYIEGRVRL